jgi:hypothetical protein
MLEVISGHRQGTMAYEYPTGAGVVRLLRIGRLWAVEFNGRQGGPWQSPDDLLEWRPLGESL